MTFRRDLTFLDLAHVRNLEKDLALKLRNRVTETLAVRKIDDFCHKLTEQKKCSAYRKSRKKPFCCHVIEINDGSFKKNLDYLDNVYRKGPCTAENIFKLKEFILRWKDFDLVEKA